MTTKTLKDSEFYRTTDLCLATTLFLIYPTHLETIDKENPRKAFFVFQKTDELDKLITSFWSGDFKVNPQEYFNALRVLKARLYNE